MPETDYVYIYVYLPHPAHRSFLGRTNLIEEDTNITTAAAEDANSPLEILRRIPEVFLEEHLSMRCDVCRMEK